MASITEQLAAHRQTALDLAAGIGATLDQTTQEEALGRAIVDQLISERDAARASVAVLEAENAALRKQLESSTRKRPPPMFGLTTPNVGEMRAEIATQEARLGKRNQIVRIFPGSSAPRAQGGYLKCRDDGRSMVYSFRVILAGLNPVTFDFKTLAQNFESDVAIGRKARADFQLLVSADNEPDRLVTVGTSKVPRVSADDYVNKLWPPFFDAMREFAPSVFVYDNPTGYLHDQRVGFTDGTLSATSWYVGGKTDQRKPDYHLIDPYVQATGGSEQALGPDLDVARGFATAHGIGFGYAEIGSDQSRGIGSLKTLMAMAVAKQPDILCYYDANFNGQFALEYVAAAQKANMDRYAAVATYLR